MRYRSIALAAALCAAALLGVSVTPAAALTTAISGKTLAIFAENPTNVQTGLFAATIVKGKKKNVLVIEATVTVLGGATFACIDSVKVNGAFAAPTTGAFNVACTATSPASSQTLAATYTFDIDAAELASPGNFYGQPLTVLVDTNTNVAGLAGSISVVVRMEKK